METNEDIGADAVTPDAAITLSRDMPPAVNSDDPAEMSTALLRVIATAAADPHVDVAKMERLLDMQTRVMARAAEMAFNQALARLKAKLPRIAKKGAIVLKDGKTRLPYARYSDVHETVMPLMLEEGLTVSYSSELVANSTLLEIRATFRHAGGHQDIGKAYLPLTDDSGAKNRVQGAGSILSYGKRYALVQYLDIVTEDEDDDGMQGEAQPIDEKQRRTILDLLANSGADEEKFLAFMRVELVEDIIVRDYDKAVNALKQKQREARRKAGAAMIDEKQQGQIRDLIADANADERLFLEFMNAKSIERIAASDYDKAVDALNMQRKGRK